MSLKERSQPDSLVEVPDSSFTFRFVIFNLLNLILLQNVSIPNTERSVLCISMFASLFA